MGCRRRRRGGILYRYDTRYGGLLCQAVLCRRVE